MKTQIYAVLALITLMLTGCAATPQAPVELNANLWENKEATIGIVMTAVPKPDLYLPGADCLLCIAAASVANSSIDKHVDTFNDENLADIKNDIAKRLNSRNIKTVVITELLKMDSIPEKESKTPNAARHDFSKLAQKYGLTHVLVIDVKLLGIHRTYASYVPTSDPKGVFTGTGYLVDMKSSTYQWYMPIEIYKSADGEWDEAPAFPALTNAYYQALATGKDQILSKF
jgi:hypothetical protein